MAGDPLQIKNGCIIAKAQANRWRGAEPVLVTFELLAPEGNFLVCDCVLIMRDELTCSHTLCQDTRKLPRRVVA